MFDEVVLDLSLGCKLLPGHLAVARFGDQQHHSLVAILQTLDRLVIHDCSLVQANALRSSLESAEDKRERSFDDDDDDDQYSTNTSRPVYYIAIGDVIKTVSVRTFGLAAPVASKQSADNAPRSVNGSDSIQASGATDALHANRPSTSPSRDLLLVGCSSSVLIYDASSQASLLSISTSTPISAITCEPPNVLLDANRPRTDYSWPTICGGSRKIYALKFNGPLFDHSGSGNFEAEISSERSTGDTVNCLAQGTLNGLDLVLIGTQEQKIRLYLLDTFEQNIQTCKLTIEELAPVSCVCPINTQSHESRQQPQQQQQRSEESPDSLLPSLESFPAISSSTSASATEAQSGEQMNYFAYGLENGIIGVYRLLQSSAAGDAPASASLARERLWCHRCRNAPLTMLMYDINGDGLDELIVGFGGSRVEARAPFTGQLLATTRCFKIDRLAGLTVMDYHNDGRPMLIACSVSGALLGFRPRIRRPRRPLQGYLLPTGGGGGATPQLLGSNQIAAGLTASWGDSSADAGVGITNLKTIEEEQDGDVFMIGRSGNGTTTGETPSDLHIETQKDQTKASKCDARQSHELLLKVNALRHERMELERRACHIYQTSMQRAAELYPVDLSVGHRWDFDYAKAHLRLTIVISWSFDEVKLIELEDRSENVLPRGYALLLPRQAQPSERAEADEKRSHVVVMPLRTKRDAESSLNLRIFCESNKQLKQEAGGGSSVGGATGKPLSRVYCLSIDVPRFSMIIFAPEQQPQISGINNERCVRLTYRLEDSPELVQMWLRKNLLCFQFGSTKPGRGDPSRSQGVPAGESLADLSATVPRDGRNNPMTDLTESFDLNLVDVRHTLERIAASGSGNPQEEEEESKFTRFASTLRIAYSNGLLSFEGENTDLVVALVQSLVIDRLHLNPTGTAAGISAADNKLLHHHQQQQRQHELPLVEASLEPILSELDTLTSESRQLEESERRIQTELYESADYTKSLMQQFAIANELNEFGNAKELLNELFMMLTGVQNSARAQSLNNRSRLELSKQVSKLEEKLALLSGRPV